MSLNNAHAHNSGVLIYAGERILIFYNAIEMTFEGPNTPHFKGKKKGRIYLTTHRMIFTSTEGKDVLQSFSFPFLNLKEIELEQPIFGANYIKGRILAEQGGNWNGEAKFKMHFNHGGAIEFGQCMLTAAKLASRNRPSQPPAYSPPSGPVYQAPPPAYEAPHTQYYDWVPYQTFPSAPPPEYVYMTEAPPPYPGVDPNAAVYPPPYSGGNTTANEKEREAAASAYYNPSNPHNAYMPTQQMQNGHYPPPPSYDDATKKQN